MQLLLRFTARAVAEGGAAGRPVEVEEAGAEESTRELLAFVGIPPLAPGSPVMALADRMYELGP